jgi:hypothetical protein
MFSPSVSIPPLRPGWRRLQREGVEGVVVNDAHGLLMRSSGAVPKHTGAVTELMRCAQQLDRGDQDTPVITIETDRRRVVITAGECGSTIAVFTADSHE